MCFRLPSQWYDDIRFFILHLPVQVIIPYIIRPDFFTHCQPQSNHERCFPAAYAAGLDAGHDIRTGKRCVVLVDEYDKPLLETVEDKELAEHNRNVFKGFFSTLKSEDAYRCFGEMNQ